MNRMGMPRSFICLRLVLTNHHNVFGGPYKGAFLGTMVPRWRMSSCLSERKAQRVAGQSEWGLSSAGTVYRCSWQGE